MRWKLRKRKPTHRPHIWDGWYCCIECGVYWHSKYLESYYGSCPGWNPDAEDD